MNSNKSHLEILGKILSEKNIKILFDNTMTTAAVDLKDGTILFPKTSFSEELETMLLCHECSHVIWTPADEWIDYIKKYPERKVILNIVEDARIDRLFVEHYRGAAKLYNNAAKELKRIDFFEIDGKTNFNFINNLNLAKKLREYFIPEFNNQIEVDLFKRLSKTETFNDVVKLTEDIIAYLPKSKQMPTNSGDTDEQDGNGSSDNIASTGNNLDGADEQCQDIITLGAQLDQFIDETKLGEIYTKKQKLEKMTIYVPNVPCNVKKIDPPRVFTQNFDDTNAQALAKRFRLRKNAYNISKTKEFSSGKLNTDKLYKYKFCDNLFLKNEIITNEENHSLIFIIDLSGSMKDKIWGLQQRLYELVKFCHIMRIPFIIFGYNCSGILQIGSHKDKINVIAESIGKLNVRVNGSTPTSDAAINLCPNIKDFVQKNRKTKNVLIHMSDGMPDKVHTNSTATWKNGVYFLNDITNPFGLIKKYCGLHSVLGFFFWSRSPNENPVEIGQNSLNPYEDYDLVFSLDSGDLTSYNSQLVTKTIEAIR